MGLSETSKGIDAIVLPRGSRRAVESSLRRSARAPVDTDGSARLESARRQVLAYLAGERKEFDLPLDLSSGTRFQRQVWRVLQRVPYGKVRSYRWVALPVGANPLPIVIPCHRIVAQDASLGGFSGGLPTKRRLLKLEGTLAWLKPGKRRVARARREKRI
jgi:O-6-methylguanine DNA methyltransferase